MNLKSYLRNALGLLACLVVALILVASVCAQNSPDRKVVKMVKPEYPSLLRQKQIGGTVKLKVRIKADGTVKSTEVVGGNAILIDSAQTAVAQWRFAPAESETVQELSVVFNPHADN